MDEIRPAKAVVEFDEFARLDLRIGRVLECREHTNADKLLVLRVDLGEAGGADSASGGAGGGSGGGRQICAVLKQHYKPEDLVGKLVVVVANLEPRSMRGEVSQGLVLSASEGPQKQHAVILTVAGDIAPGSVVG